MPTTCLKTVLPEQRPESDRRRRFVPICGARRRRDSTAMNRELDSRASDSVTLERRLGQADAVEVWLATLAGFGTVAIKFPAVRWSGHEGATRLIEREFEFLQRAAHAGVVPAIDLLPWSSGRALVMDYLPGGDLVALAGSHPRYWAGFVRDVSRALAHVHARGIVHGDVKPRNVLLDGNGGAKLIDFGVAADVGDVRHSSGTPAYRRAATVSNGRAEFADDFYAFAAMIYELLCGRLPFGRSPDERTAATPPVPVLEIQPAYSHELNIVQLAGLVEALLSAENEAPDRPLDALDALLAAIIAEPD